MRDHLCAVLGEGYDVLLAENGARALELVRAAQPHVVVSDVMMPEMDGFELVARMKRDPSLRHIPVILLTAKAGRESLVDGLNLGADDYLAKPFHPTELRARVDAARRLHDVYVELSDNHRQLEAAHVTLKETQAQLVHAARIAAVGTLVAGLSHELNNPLGIILMNAQTLLREPAPDEPTTRRALTVIEKHTRRCAKLVETLLDFSRRKTAKREPLDVGRLLTRVVDLASVRAHRTEVTLEIEPLPDQPMLVSCCTHELETAMLNFVSNAMDATPPNGTVRLAARSCLHRNAAHVEIRVEDSGHGISKEILSRVFDPFFTTKPEGQGTGLGLSLARKIVEDHGGELVLESSPGQGTTVRVWLPTDAAEHARKGVA
jgi:signal transduction histidine kinase